MPMYEYICKECSHHFESIVQGSSVPECPVCKTKNLEKQLSAFAVGGGNGEFGFESGPGPCGTCGDPRGPGACTLD